jgi:WD40 repeat protein
VPSAADQLFLPVVYDELRSLNRKVAATSWKASEYSLTCVAYSPDGRHIASAGADDAAQHLPPCWGEDLHLGQPLRRVSKFIKADSAFLYQREIEATHLAIRLAAVVESSPGFEFPSGAAEDSDRKLCRIVNA